MFGEPMFGGVGAQALAGPPPDPVTTTFQLRRRVTATLEVKTEQDAALQVRRTVTGTKER